MLWRARMEQNTFEIKTIQVPAQTKLPPCGQQWGAGSPQQDLSQHSQVSEGYCWMCPQLSWSWQTSLKLFEKSSCLELSCHRNSSTVSRHHNRLLHYMLSRSCHDPWTLERILDVGKINIGFTAAWNSVLSLNNDGRWVDASFNCFNTYCTVLYCTLYS